MTTQYTVTVTQAAAVVTSTSAVSPMQDESTLDGSNGTGGSAQNGSGNPSNGADSSLGNGSPVNDSTADGSPADSSIAPKRTKCSKVNAAGTAAARASAGIGSLYGNATAQGSRYPVVANTSSPSGSSSMRNSTGSLTGLNTTATMNHTADANLHGQFWAGGMYISRLSFLFQSGPQVARHIMGAEGF